MTRTEMVYKVAYERGFEDCYTLLIAKIAEDLTNTDKVVMQMMYDILLGISYSEE